MNMCRPSYCGLVLMLTMLAGHAVAAAQSPLADLVPTTIDGPAAPTAPAVINRDARGAATIRATRIDTPLQMDGRLDEEIYRTIAPVGDFVQQVPIEGAPATEPTEAWVFFDDDNLYIAARCYTSRPDREVATELRRDNVNISRGDNVLVILDTFYDQRNGYYFQTNPLGALRDATVSDAQGNTAWSTVWDARSARFAQGWDFEMVIPFKSLRYPRPGPQVWRINFRRIVKSKNEVSHVTPVPPSYGDAGVLQLAWAANLVGLETPANAMNVEFKPYVLGSLTTDQVAAQPYRNDFTRDVGVDFKYGLTSGLTADVTVNTDFAQVEEDLQQINLTRFSLFFPEKRDFFLERQEIFNFGSDTSLGNAGADPDVPLLFFSRRIGLSQGQAVPVVAGGRVTGKVGAFDLGLLNIQAADKRSAGAVATNFSALRVKRDIFEQSSIGVIATHRMPTSSDLDSSFAAGIDGSLRLSDNLSATAYYARTATPGAEGDETSYRGRVEYSGDRYGLIAEHLVVGDAFDPAVGFVRRDDFRRSSVRGRFSPRLRNHQLIRRLYWLGTLDYITDVDVTAVENRTFVGDFVTEFHNSDTAVVGYRRDYERLPADFSIAPDVVVPRGSYVSDAVSANYTLGQQHALSGTVAASWSTFYGGTRTETSYGGRIGLAPQFVLEPAFSLNWVSLPYGDFTARLLSTRVIVTPTPRLMIAGLVQLNPSANTLSSSARMSWEYVPGSHLFLVYSDGRDTAATGGSLLNRSIAIKVTRLLRL